MKIPDTDTPRTTALVYPNGAMSIEILELTRTLERELIAMTGTAAQYKQELECMKESTRALMESNRSLVNGICQSERQHFHHESYCRKCNEIKENSK